MRHYSSTLIADKAMTYFEKYDQGTLLDMLVETWSLAESDSIATRSELTDYLKGVVQQIAKEVVKHQDVVAATMGVVTSEVLDFARASGYDLDVYEIPIAILVAVVAKAVVVQLGITLKKKP